MTGRQTAALLVLCLWSSMAWLSGDLLRERFSPIGGEGYRLFLLGVVSCFARSSHIFRERAAWRRYVVLSCASLGIMGAPLLLLYQAAGKIASTDRTLVFALMPTAIALAGGTALAEKSDSAGLTPVLYNLLAVAGMLMLLPFHVPEGLSAWIAAGCLVLAMLLTGASMIVVHRIFARLSAGAALPAILLANGVLLLAFAAAGPVTTPWSLQAAGAESVRALATDLPETLLLVWLLQEVSPLRLSSLYLIGPLFTVIEGFFIFRPRIDPRAGVGVTLMALGAALTLFAKGSDDSTSLRLT